MRDIRVERVRKNFYITLLVFVAVLALTYIFTRPLKVTKVLEGGILVLSNGKKVCLIGVDASEQANAFVKEMVEGKEIKLVQNLTDCLHDRTCSEFFTQILEDEKTYHQLLIHNFNVLQNTGRWVGI